MLTALFVSLTLAGVDVPMPPPPPGMVLLAQAAPQVASEDAGTLDAGAQPQPTVAALPREEDEPEADAELEAMRALEEVTIDPHARSGASMRATLGDRKSVV